MTETIKAYSESILKEINNSNNILLHCHPSADSDSVGSVLAMKFALESMGKKATVIRGDTEIPKSFDFPGINTIVQKSYAEIDKENFDLFLVLDSSSKNMISFKSEVIFPEKMKVIVIDHHKSNENFGHINCVDSSYPSTAQIVFDLLKSFGIKIDHDIAINIFIGMYTDTGGFKYGNVNSETFKIVSELVSYATDFTETIFTLENSATKESLIFEGLALSSIKDFYEGKLAISSITYEQMRENNIKSQDIISSSISNKIKSVIGFDVGVCLVEEESNLIKVSFRTRYPQKYDLTKIAKALGGGGHIAAAGARINSTMDDAIHKVVENFKLIYNL